jgi:hypothetical protein
LVKLICLLAVNKVVHTGKQQIDTGTCPVAASKVVNSSVYKKANQEPGDLSRVGLKPFKKSFHVNNFLLQCSMQVWDTWQGDPVP